MLIAWSSLAGAVLAGEKRREGARREEMRRGGRREEGDGSKERRDEFSKLEGLVFF